MQSDRKNVKSDFVFSFFIAMDGSTVIARKGSHIAISSVGIKKVVSAGLRLVKIL